LVFSVDKDVSDRPDAIFLEGEPISHLPTQRIFSYVSYFDSPPKGLEWVSDTTCVLVYPSIALARTAYASLRKDSEKGEDDRGFVQAKILPKSLWPIEDRLNEVLGKSRGLSGPIMMRWARRSDVKDKAAYQKSEYYKKYGREMEPTVGGSTAKRQRFQKERSEQEKEEEKARLDAELEGFIAPDDLDLDNPKRHRDDEDELNAKPMRAPEPGTLAARLGVTSMRRPPSDSRRIAPLPRSRVRDDGGRKRGRRDERPSKGKQDLDDELDAFLRAKDSAAA
jgi:hypothetical protein